MIKFIPFTFIAYLAIDFAVYWLGNSKNITISEVVAHHLKMLPIYLVSNILLTIGFISAIEKDMNPLILFSISMFIWVVSLIIVSAVLYKSTPNFLSLFGFLFVIVGMVLIHLSVKN